MYTASVTKGFKKIYIYIYLGIRTSSDFWEHLHAGFKIHSIRCLCNKTPEVKKKLSKNLHTKISKDNAKLLKDILEGLSYNTGSDIFPVLKTKS